MYGKKRTAKSALGWPPPTWAWITRGYPAFVGHSGGWPRLVDDASVAAPEELKVREQLLSVYERLSRAKRIPLIGNALFGIMDYFQQIQPAYPRVDLSKPSIQTKWTESMVKKGLCEGMIKRINTKPLPFITSYYAAAVAADMALLAAFIA